MTVSTVSSLNSLFNKIYEDAIFTARDENLMTMLVTRYAARGLAERKLPIYPALTASEITEGVVNAASVEWNKSTQMTLTPIIAKTPSVILTESMIQTDPDTTAANAATEMGAALATKIDTDLTGLFSGFSGAKGTAGSALTLRSCAAAMSVLRNNKARPPFSFVIHPYQWTDIWLELGQPATTQAFLGDVANMAMKEFAVQRHLGANWYTSANITPDGSDDASGAVFNREALAFDIRQAPMLLKDYDSTIAGGGGYRTNMEAWYAVGERRDAFGVELISDVTEPT